MQNGPLNSNFRANGDRIRRHFSAPAASTAPQQRYIEVEWRTSPSCFGSRDSQGEPTFPEPMATSFSHLFHSSPTASIELEQHESILFLGLVAAKTNLLSLNIWRLRSKIFLYSREKWPPTQKILWFSSEPRTARFDCLTPERKVQFREVVGVML
jgi:hypothetical protein